MAAAAAAALCRAVAACGARARRVALRVAGLLGAGGGVAIVCIFGGYRRAPSATANPNEPQCSPSEPQCAPMQPQ
ncbi:uncharacterized protein AAGF69_015253 [Amazona ochrocephala]